MANSRLIPASGRKKVLPIVAGIIQFFNADGNFMGNRFNVFQIYNDGSAPLYIGSDANIGASGENSLATVVAGGAVVLSIVGGIDTLHLRAAANGSVRIFYFYEENLTSNQLYQNLATVIINSGLATNVTVVAEIPAGTKKIGGVDVVTLPALPAGDNAIGTVGITGTVANVSSSGPGVITILTLSVMDAEYSVNIPAGTRKVEFTARSAAKVPATSTMNIRLAWAAGIVAAGTGACKTFTADKGYSLVDHNFPAATPIYFASGTLGMVIEMTTYA